MLPTRQDGVENCDKANNLSWNELMTQLWSSLTDQLIDCLTDWLIDWPSIDFWKTKFLAWKTLKRSKSSVHLHKTENSTFIVTPERNIHLTSPHIQAYLLFPGLGLRRFKTPHIRSKLVMITKATRRRFLSLCIRGFWLPEDERDASLISGPGLLIKADILHVLLQTTPKWSSLGWNLIRL